mmetsp:Transcript_71022/g.154376  ORF Transcript_71022/g.154376 Transcript_71022/m.154376 type:complete len:223 (-) Transcript_71022:40-708(-)
MYAALSQSALSISLCPLPSLLEPLPALNSLSVESLPTRGPSRRPWRRSWADQSIHASSYPHLAPLLADRCKLSLGLLEPLSKALKLYRALGYIAGLPSAFLLLEIPLQRHLLGFTLPACRLGIKHAPSRLPAGFFLGCSLRHRCHHGRGHRSDLLSLFEPLLQATPAGCGILVKSAARCLSLTSRRLARSLAGESLRPLQLLLLGDEGKPRLPCLLALRIFV